MRKKILPLLVLSCFAINSFAQSNLKNTKGLNQQTSAKKGKAQFKFLANDDTHDYGTIPEGPVAVFEFQFVNVGDAPLIITNAQASCGCTTPEYSKEPVLPGKKGKIKVSYTTEGHVGNFNKSIYLTSNAISNSNFLGKDYYELKIKGIVQAKKQ